MKSLKYSLFLSVASVCMFSSSLVAAATVQQVPTVQVPGAPVVASALKVDPSHAGQQAPVLTPTPQLQVPTVQVPASAQLLVPAQHDPSALVTPAPQLPVLAPVTAHQVQVDVPVVNAGGQLLQANPTTPVVLVDPTQHAGQQTPVLTPAPQLQVPTAPLVAPTVQAVNLGAPLAPTLTLDPTQHAGQQAPVLTPTPQLQVPTVQVPAPAQLLVSAQHDPSALVTPAPQLPVLAPVTASQVQVGVPVVNAGGQVTPTTPVAQQLQVSAPVTAPQLLVPAQHDASALVTAPPQLLPATPVSEQNVEKQTVKEVVATEPTERAKELVDALVAHQMAASGVQQPDAALSVTGSEIIAAPLAPAKKVKPTLTPEQALALASAKDAQAAGRPLTQEETNALLAVEALKAEKANRRAAKAAANPASVPAAPTTKVKKTKAGGLSAESVAALNAAKLAKAQNAPLTQEQTDALVKAETEIAALKASKQQQIIAAPVESELPPVGLFDVPAVNEVPAAQHEVPVLAPSSIPAVESQLPAAVVAAPVVAAPLAPAPVLATLDAAPNGVTIDAKLVMNGKGEVVVTTTSSLNPPSTTPLAIGPAVGVTDKPTGVEKPATVDINAKKVEEKPAAVTVKDDATAKKEEVKKPAETKKDEIPAGDANKDAAGNIEAPKTAEVAAVK